ncbi:hypothetical protein J1605_017883 [Eschrichtius robustus]|uniref:Transmembrane protein n=1 Tax=Eschrichtius robustus TaxID=9764 RepID=A0AB34HZM5_ESCRO|nr:hypothetical protein J1605_017883 [Eschrichtius robustus]
MEEEGDLPAHEAFRLPRSLPSAAPPVASRDSATEPELQGPSRAKSAPVTFSPFAVAIFLSVCMSSFVWGGSGDHVGGKSEEAPGAWDEVTVVGTPLRLPPTSPLRAGGPVSPGGNSGLQLWPGKERHEISRRLARV